MLKKILIGIGLTFVGLLVAFFLWFQYETRWKLTEVGTATSPDKQYRVVFQEKGEPDWPFGSSHARIRIYRGENLIQSFDEDVADDGARFNTSNYTVEWEKNRVIIIFTGSEQEPVRRTVPL